MQIAAWANVNDHLSRVNQPKLFYTLLSNQIFDSGLISAQKL